MSCTDMSTQAMFDSCSKLNSIVGSDWFNTSWKCSVHLFIWSSFVSSTLASLLLMGTLLLLLAPVSSRTIRYSVFGSLLSAAACASEALSSNQRFFVCSTALLHFFIQTSVHLICLPPAQTCSCLISCCFSDFAFVDQFPRIGGDPPLLIESSSLTKYCIGTLFDSLGRLHCSSKSMQRQKIMTRFIGKPVEVIATMKQLTQQQIIAWPWRTQEQDNKVMKGECKSIVNAIKAFLGDMPWALWFHNANEDQMCMFGGPHFHVVAYTGHNAIARDLSHYESYSKLSMDIDVTVTSNNTECVTSVRC